MARLNPKLPRWSFGVLLVGTPQLAAATSCDTAKIAARSVDETAKVVWDTSDYLGLAVAEQVPGPPETQQQKIKFLVVLKGSTQSVDLEPRVLNRVSQIDGALRWVDTPDQSLKLVGLVKTGAGAVMPYCLLENIRSKPVDQLFKALVARSDMARSVGKPR